MPVRRARSEDGFTMVATMIGVFVVALLAAVAVAAVNGDTHSGLRDFEQKQAYEAAKAGIDEYAYHLHIDNGYWAKCTGVTAPVNQQGSTTKKRELYGSGSEYALELIPANGKTTCDSSSIAAATASMLQSNEPLKGTFQIRSTGFYGKAKSSIMATFKPASFLDYVYVTHLETSDPVTYGPNLERIEGAEDQCGEKLFRTGRMDDPIPGTKTWNSRTREYEYEYCNVISFVTGDEIKGPMHTDDAFALNGEPQLGRSADDRIEMSEPAEHGNPRRAWYQTKEIPNSGCSNCSGSSAKFKGSEVGGAGELPPPETNSQLKEIAESGGVKFKGQVHICLNGITMSFGKGSECTTPVSWPSNGVIYVENEASCGLYSPFKNEYEETSKCGNVYVHGTYSKSLTIAAGNDIIIDGNLTHSGALSMLGLIANNFIRIYHPIGTKKWTERVCNKYGSNCHNEEYEECINASGSLENVTVEAALLAIKHSFIVDNYTECSGKPLGTLKVVGAIAQRYRGAVGTGGGTSTSTGYLKNYEYDDRLKTIEPPSFLEPVESDWVVGRETVG